MRAPDHRDVDRGLECGQHAGRLRVVEDHDVVRPHHLHERRRIGGAPVLVCDALGVAQGPAVAQRPVQPVVQALGEDEEVVVTLGDHPAAVDPRSADVADQ